MKRELIKYSFIFHRVSVVAAAAGSRMLDGSTSVGWLVDDGDDHHDEEK